MNTIELRGVIVPSQYDVEWAGEFIERGIVMPESRFRALLKAAMPNAPLTIYVNSPGGSVFAANEMINAALDWKLATGQTVTVVIGALAASAAAGFAVMVADRIMVHSNTKMMFHGAWTLSIGGAGTHQDTADLLQKMDDDIRGYLIAKYSLDADVVAGWFDQGREGWLSASDLIAAGMANQIIADPAEALNIDDETIEAIEAHGIGIAALMDRNGGKNGLSGEGNVGIGAGDRERDPSGDNGVDQSDRAAWLEVGRAEKTAECAEQIAALEERNRRLQGDRDRVRAELDKLRAESAAEAEKLEARYTETVNMLMKKISLMQAKYEKLIGGALTFSPNTADKVGCSINDVDPRKRLHPALR